MTLFAAILAAAAQAAATHQLRMQWHARPARPGARAAARWAAFGPSTRTTIALATAAGMICAEQGAAWLVEGVVWAAAVTGLDAAVWAPASVDVVFAAVVAAGLADLTVLGLYRGAWLRPALRHGLIGLALPTVVVAGWPLLAQTATDAASTLGGAPEVAACAPADLPGDTIAGYGPDRLANAKVIADTGKALGVPERGQLIALATAMQESGLENLDYGDRDSLGLFQQRPSQGWGSPAQVRDPVYAATQFYDRLLAIPDWAELPLWQSAQAVQRSAYPTYYAKHEDAAAQVLGAVTETTCGS